MEKEKKEEGGLGPGAATKLEDEVAKTSSDSPTKRVEGPGKALGKEEQEGTEQKESLKMRDCFAKHRPKTEINHS